MAEFFRDTSLLWSCGLATPWLSGLLLAGLPRRADRIAPLLAIAGAFCAAALLSASLWSAHPGSSPEVVLRLPWVEGLGLEFLLIRDGLSVMFALLIAWTSFLICMYAWRYLPHANRHEGSDRSQRVFYAFLSLFTGGMLGVVSAGNLLQLYFFWELTSIASYLLIGYWHHQPEARQGARLALGVTVGGSIVMLIGFFWLALQAGNWNVAELLAASGRWRGEGWLEGCAILILIGALSKSAQAPFSSWLPAAMKAPTPVSAFLHSSALLAAGLYLLARFYQLLHATAAWWWLLVIPGAVGTVLAGVLAVRQKEMKPLLAYSTIGQFAFMFLAFGLGSRKAVQAALYAFFLHTFIKAGLFMMSGAVTHVTGRRSLAHLGGLIRSNRMLAAIGIVLGVALTSFPAFGAFYYEELYLKAAREAGDWIIYALFATGGMLSFAYVGRLLYEIFAGREPFQKETERVPLSMGLAMGLPALVIVWTAVDPQWMAPLVLDAAVGSALGGAGPALKTAIHFDAVFWTSIAAMIVGWSVWVLFQFNRRVSSWWRRLPELYHLGGGAAAALYSRLALLFLSLHTGHLGHYLRIIFVTTIGMAAAVWAWSGSEIQAPVGAIDVPLTIALAATVITSGASLFIRYYLTFVLVLTLSGFAMAAAFVLMGAPNVALAQVLVEILIDLSIILALKESLRVHPEKTRCLKETAGRANFWRLAIALGIGALAGFGTYWAAQGYPAEAVGQWYVQEGLRLHKKDFVALILTDFRALDTLVELMVFTAGMFAVLGLYWHEEIAGE